MNKNTLTEVEVGKIYNVQLNFGSYTRIETLEARNTAQGLAWVYSSGRQIFIDKRDVILNEVEFRAIMIEISTEVFKLEDEPEQVEFTFGEKFPENGFAIMVLTDLNNDVWNYYDFHRNGEEVPYIRNQEGRVCTFHSQEIWKYV